MSSVRPCLSEQPHGLRPDAVKGEEAVEIRRQVCDGAVTGVEERASRGPADPDTVEDGAAILGVDHAPRIGIASSDGLRDSRGDADDVDLDPPIHGWNAGRTKRFAIGGGVSVDEEARDGEPGVDCKLRLPWGWQRPECFARSGAMSRPAATTVAGAASPCHFTELAL